MEQIPINYSFRQTDSQIDKNEFLGPFQLKSGVQKIC